MKRKDFLDYYSQRKWKRLFRWIDLRKICLLKKIIKGKKTTLKILDLGCGDSTILPKAGIDDFVVGDINRSLLKLSRTKNPSVKCCQLDCDGKLPFKDNSFDVVLMVDSIEHMKYPHTIVKEVVRILKKNGLFVVFTPPYDSVTWVFAEKVHNLLTRSNCDHVTPFIRESLVFLLESYFQTVTVKKLNLGLTMYGIARKS